jgi:hypothetical protein
VKSSNVPVKSTKVPRARIRQLQKLFRFTGAKNLTGDFIDITLSGNGITFVGCVDKTKLYDLLTQLCKQESIHFERMDIHGMPYSADTRKFTPKFIDTSLRGIGHLK